jgi:hypothetical protein
VKKITAKPEMGKGEEAKTGLYTRISSALR